MIKLVYDISTVEMQYMQSSFNIIFLFNIFKLED